MQGLSWGIWSLSLGGAVLWVVIFLGTSPGTPQGVVSPDLSLPSRENGLNAYTQVGQSGFGELEKTPGVEVTSRDYYGNATLAEGPGCMEHADSVEVLCTHVVYCLDDSEKYTVATIASLKSLLLATRLPVCAHLVTPRKIRDEFIDVLVSAATGPLFLEVVVCSVALDVRVWDGTDLHKNKFNYARFFIPQLLSPYSSVCACIYLDPDTLVQVDLPHRIARLLSGSKEPFVLAAVPAAPTADVEALLPAPAADKEKNSICFLVNCTAPIVARMDLDTTASWFNAGVFIANVTAWRERRATRTMVDLLDANMREPLWRWGSQAALNLAFAGLWHALPQGWNYGASKHWSGMERDVLARMVCDVLTQPVLHFRGTNKPWRRNNPTALFWCWAVLGSVLGRGSVGTTCTTNQHLLAAVQLPMWEQCRLDRLYRRWERDADEGVRGLRAVS